jgi:hypothetical protein
MTDLSHQWGSDLSLGPTGDLALASGSEEGQQRILRRLLTNPLDYIWQPQYGAGLASFVGEPADSLRIRARVRGQISREPAVARSPEPNISVEIPASGTGASIYLHILYSDAATGHPQLLDLPLGA